MKVSILIITYNQEKYITAAINSALAQATSFDYEIIVGEDASTDGTRKIVLDFQKQHPDRIRVLLRDATDSDRERALGFGSKTNFTNSLQACKGQYIAILDGDDYWTDTLKLQKQVDFLDSHLDFAICCHNVTMLYEDGSKEPANLFPPDQKEISTLEDLLFTNVIQFCSVLFRRGLFGELPDWFSKIIIGDWALHIMNAQHGKIRYFPEAMAVYRVHQQGVWSGSAPVGRGLEVVKMLDYVDAYLGFKYKKQICTAKANWYWELAQICHRQGDHIQARGYLRKYFWLGGLRTCRNLLSFILQTKTPALYQSLRSLKEFLSPAKPNHPGVSGVEGNR